jgi:hypothetical protein
MNESRSITTFAGVGLAALVTAYGGVASAASADTPAPRQRLREPVYRVAFNQPTAESTAAASQVAPTTTPKPSAVGAHPLVAVLDFAKAGLQEVDQNIKDYSCTLVKRERISGTLSDSEYVFLKVRHEPFSVYMYFLGPQAIKGRECIFVDGGNNGKLVAHEGKGFRAKLGTFHLDPNGLIAMRGQRYPITEVGIRNLTARLIEVGTHDTQYGECEVKWFKDTKVDNRKCTCIQATHPVSRKQFRFHMARIFVDDQLRIPIRYASWQWPSQAGGPPLLDEEYTYVNIKVNNGFTDADFAERNPSYRF